MRGSNPAALGLLFLRLAAHVVIDFCPALAALVSPVQNIFLTAHFLTLLVIISSSNLGRQSCWVACLCVSGNCPDLSVDMTDLVQGVDVNYIFVFLTAKTLRDLPKHP